MVKIHETTAKIHRVSTKRPQALILPIPAHIRDMMEFKHGTKIKIDVCLDEKNKKYLRIQEKID